MANKQNLLNQFDTHFKKINEELKSNIGEEIALLEDIGRHSLLGEGKRLRPLLFVLACHLCDNSSEDIYSYSTIFEYLHFASLLHDDVLDNADIRRKKASANSIWGNSVAVLSGDYFSTMAIAMAFKANKHEFAKLVNDACHKMVRGQILELVNTNNWQLKREEYLEIIKYKTGALISSACSCAAVFSGADKKNAGNLSEFGMNLGMAFQIIDDFLDYTSSEETFGKPVGKDLMEGKVTLPLIYMLEDMDKSEVGRMESLFKGNNAEEGDYQEVIEKVRGSIALEKVRKEANDYVKKASESLMPFPDSDLKTRLLDVNRYMAERDF